MRLWMHVGETESLSLIRWGSERFKSKYNGAVKKKPQYLSCKQRNSNENRINANVDFDYNPNSLFLSTVFFLAVSRSSFSAWRCRIIQFHMKHFNRCLSLSMSLHLKFERVDDNFTKRIVIGINLFFSVYTLHTYSQPFIRIVCGIKWIANGVFTEWWNCKIQWDASISKIVQWKALELCVDTRSSFSRRTKHKNESLVLIVYGVWLNDQAKSRCVLCTRVQVDDIGSTAPRFLNFDETPCKYNWNFVFSNEKTKKIKTNKVKSSSVTLFGLMHFESCHIERRRDVVRSMIVFVSQMSQFV